MIWHKVSINHLPCQRLPSIGDTENKSENENECENENESEHESESVHQPPTLVSTFLALTLMIYFHYIENESENESEIDNESTHQPTTLVSTFLSSINIVDSAKWLIVQNESESEN